MKKETKTELVYIIGMFIAIIFVIFIWLAFAKGLCEADPRFPLCYLMCLPL